MDDYCEKTLPILSVIIPVRNEEKNIVRCLDNIALNSYPKNKLEIIVVDGESTDKTTYVLQEYIEKHREINIKILKNPQKITPTALNIGIKHAKGSLIGIIGAHNYISNNYLLTAAKYLQDNKADCVGGIGICIPTGKKLVSRAIPLAMNSRFGAGNSFRTNYSKKVMRVDTVPSPVYKKEVFKEIGYFNEELARSQDIEFNSRLRKRNGKILLVSETISYYNERAGFKDFLKKRFIDGFWAVYPFKFTNIMPVSLTRHLIPLIFVLSFIGSGVLSFFFLFSKWVFLCIIVSYCLINIYFSTKIAVKEKDCRYLFLMPVVFTALHMSYGLGSVLGTIRLLLPAKKD